MTRTPSPALDRRSLLKGAVAVGALGLGGRAAEAATAGQAARTVFGYGVASGDPLGTAVIIWTRVTPSPDAVPGSGRGAATDVVWEVAADKNFRRVVRRGTVRTSAARDHTVKVDVTGLQPYTVYWYRFRALGRTSTIGKTQTAGDDGSVHALRFGLVSCSNLTGGYFTAYRHLARRDDLDVVVHLGDYFYEYGNDGDRYGPAGLRGKREHQPPYEPVTLADYRLRHACYKADADLQVAHQRFPWIVIFDDHEVTNDTHGTGAENHEPADDPKTSGVKPEGDFLTRRQAAYTAYVEWMPIRVALPVGGRQRFWRRYSFGPIADLFVIETRQNRDAQIPGEKFAEVLQPDQSGVDDPVRRMLEPAQLDFLTKGLAAPGHQWRFIGNQTVITQVRVRGLPSLTSEQRQLAAAAGLLPAEGISLNLDQWDGYPADRQRVLDAVEAGQGDVVVLTGDIHSSWANDVPRDGASYVPGVTPSLCTEFVTTSITSENLNDILGRPEGDPATVGAVASLQAENRNVRFLDFDRHGYAVVDVTPERVQCEWWWISDREDPQATVRRGAAWQTTKGSKRVVPATAALPYRRDRPGRHS